MHSGRWILPATFLAIPATALGQQSAAEEFGERLREVEQQIERADALLEAGKVAEARAVLQSARAALRTPLSFGSGIKRYVSENQEVAEGKVSVVKVRVVNAYNPLPTPDRVLELEKELGEQIDDKTRRWMKVWALALGAVRSLSPEQWIDAEIREVHSVGIHALERTLRGSRFPDRKRRDLVPGRTVKLIDLEGELREGREYWVVIDPPATTELIPMVVGGIGKSVVRFAEPAAGSPDASSQNEAHSKPPERPDHDGESHSLLGRPAPPFRVGLLDGTALDLSEQKENQVLILDFWTTWCGPCVRALPILAEVAKEYEDRGVRVYAVNLGEDESTIHAFMDKQDYELTIALDKDEKVAALYGVSRIPQAVLIDKAGFVQAVHVGGLPGFKGKLRKELDALLAGEALVEPGASAGRNARD